MPDHAHLLVEGLGRDANLQEFIRLWKQCTAFEARRALGVTLWQRSYYEHILRDDESTDAKAAYILANPVRAGLVADPAQYPWIGSLTASLDALIEIALDRGGRAGPA